MTDPDTDYAAGGLLSTVPGRQRDLEKRCSRILDTGMSVPVLRILEIEPGTSGSPGFERAPIFGI